MNRTTGQHLATSRRRAPSLLAILLATAVLVLIPASAQAAPPRITSLSFSEVTDTSVTLEAKLDPNGSNSKARFQYTPLAAYKAEGFTGATSVPVPDFSVPFSVKGKGDATAGSPTVKNLTTTGGAFAPGQTITVGPFPPGTTIKAVGTDPITGQPQLTLSQAATETKAEANLTATGAQPLSVELSGITPATGYRFRLTAANTKAVPEEATGPEDPKNPGSFLAVPEATFFTLAAPPVFGPCANDAFRSGELAPLGTPGASLPDCRSYEQATPLNKNAGDTLATSAYAKAASEGSGVIFGSTFGLPGGSGAQGLPFYLASRDTDAWSSQGLFPPASTGEKGRGPIGWLPDFSASFASARKLGNPQMVALLELHRDGSPPITIAPYAPMGLAESYSYIGASAEGSTIVFEAPVQVAPAEGEEPIEAANPDRANVYAWDRDTGRVSLAGVMNDGEAPGGGAFAGAFNWAEGRPAESAASQSYYLSEIPAVSADGSLFFTVAGSGQLYRRINPTEPQSAVVINEGKEECTEPQKACTIHVSASQRSTPDTAGPQPAALQAASADGSVAYFTSPEELTDDANTGPPQPPARIGQAEIGPEEAEAIKANFLPAHALGIAIDPAGEYIYWADPSTGMIGRAKLKADGSGVEDLNPTFVEPGGVDFEVEYTVSEILHKDHVSGPSAPRYVAVDDEYVYWTNTSPLDSETAEPIDFHGTVGRARIDGAGPEPVDPDFITGASNPQGIAVNTTHLYWANAAKDPIERSISKADVDGENVFPDFALTNQWASYGIALNATHVYFSINDEANDGGYIGRVPLGGGFIFRFVGSGSKIRGVALDATHVYWAAQGEGAIGRADLDLENRDNDYAEAISGDLVGLAANAERLYFSVNGESPTNPGNDLYRFSAASETLEDLTPVGAGDGAEVQGVLGASADGSRVYFVANAVLDDAELAEPGDCHGRVASAGGSCNLYLWEEGQIDLIARLDLDGGINSDTRNWVPGPHDMYGGNSYHQRTSLLSPDGETLLFRSREQLTDYDNDGVPQFYRYRVGEGIRCITCNPTALAPQAGAGIGQITYPSLEPDASDVAAVSSRILSSDGNRVFFETAEALVGADTNGVPAGQPDRHLEEGEPDPCPKVSGAPYPSCLDVYQWEAPGTGSCTLPGPSYSPLNEGCIYLISTGHSPFPALFADASASGGDVFFFTRDQLVGQDTDLLQDVYDARVGGGLAAQNPLPATECEGEGCLGGSTPPPDFTAPPSFSGPGNPAPRRGKCSRAKRKAKRCKAKKRGRKARPAGRGRHAHRQGGRN
jgi:hypothetical protein